MKPKNTTRKSSPINAGRKQRDYKGAAKRGTMKSSDDSFTQDEDEDRRRSKHTGPKQYRSQRELKNNRSADKVMSSDTRNASGSNAIRNANAGDMLWPESMRSMMPVSITGRLWTNTVEYQYSEAGFLLQREAGYQFTNANGLAVRQADILSALDRIAENKNLKDWVTAQRESARDIFLYALDALTNLVALFKFAKYSPRYIIISGSDAGTIWTQETLNDIINEMAFSQLIIPTALIPLIKALNPVFVVTPEDSVRNISPTMLMMTKNTYAAADFRTLIRTWAGLTEGKLHLDKIGVPYTKFTPAMMQSLTQDEVKDFQNIRDPLTLYWRSQCKWAYKDSAGGSQVLTPQGAMSANMTTDYTLRSYFYWAGTSPYPLLALQIWLEPYQAVNCTRGTLQVTSQAGDANGTWNVTGYSYDGATAAKIADAAASTNAILNIIGCVNGAGTAWTPTNMTAGNSYYSLDQKFQQIGLYIESGISYTIWSDRPIVFWVAAMAPGRTSGKQNPSITS